MRKGRIARNIALIVASGLVLAPRPARAADPPPGLLRKIAERETESALAMQNYTYRQSFTVQEFDSRGAITGSYREAREIIFSPQHVRYEQLQGTPRNTLSHLRLTPVDFEDLRNIQPFLLTTDRVPFYEGRFKGEEAVAGVPCFVEYVRPRQMLAGMRYFEGLLWVRQSDLAVLKSEGQAVPQMETLREQNLTPHFSTFRKAVGDRYTFPVQTYADDTLFFREHPERIRIEIRYLDYKQFGADSTVTYGSDAPPR